MLAQQCLSRLPSASHTRSLLKSRGCLSRWYVDWAVLISVPVQAQLEQRMHLPMLHTGSSSPCVTLPDGSRSYICRVFPQWVWGHMWEREGETMNIFLEVSLNVPVNCLRYLTKVRKQPWQRGLKSTLERLWQAWEGSISSTEVRCSNWSSTQ